MGRAANNASISWARRLAASFLSLWCFLGCRNDIIVKALQMSSSSSSSSVGPRVAIVTGASRGIGRGIAVELGSQGYKVYCLGRSSRQTKNVIPGQRAVAARLDVTVESAAEEVTARGGQGFGVACDLSRDEEVERVLKQVYDEQGRLDVLVCSAYTTPNQSESLRGEFWTQSMDMWDAINGLGLRQVYSACRVAAPFMIETAKFASSPPPLICLVSSFGGKSYTFNVAYGIGKAGIDRMAVDMSYQLQKYGVATTCLYPGVVKTEANLQMLADGTWDQASGNLNLEAYGETPQFSGRAVVQLASLDKDAMMARSGKVEVVAELAKEFGFTDVDGSTPPSIRSLKYLLPNFVFPQAEKESGKPVPDWIKANVPDILLPWSTFSSGPPPEMDTR